MRSRDVEGMSERGRGHEGVGSTWFEGVGEVEGMGERGRGYGELCVNEVGAWGSARERDRGHGALFPNEVGGTRECA